MKPVLSLVTGTRNRPESFRRLVDSVERHTTVPWELVVSDASDEPYQDDFGPNVRIIPERPRLNCVKGYNIAFRAAIGEWSIWLNDDAEVMPGYDVAAIQFMEAHPQVGLGALHYSEGGGPFHVNSAWKSLYANFGIFRTRLGAEVGWFDEDLTMYGCDNSLTFRFLLYGLGVSDIPNAKVFHHSEKDQCRVENQQARSLDNRTLTEKYMPLQDRWRLTYWRLRVPTGTIPWAHGVNAELVTA